MDTFSTRGRGAPKAILALALAAALTVAAAPAQAKPPVKIGPVANLAATVTHGSGAYVVSSTWDALSAATSYKVALTSGTTTIAATSVKAPHWSAPTTLSAGTIVKVTVTPVATKTGRATSLSVVLPDVTPPTGTFTLTQAHGAQHVDLSQVTLGDDLTQATSITKVIDWGDGSHTSWTGTSMPHDYPAGKNVYYPQVTLTDQAGNAAVIDLHTVVVGDFDAPIGAFTVAQPTAWATYTPVSLTQGSLTDDLSTPEKIARVVDWDDDSPAVGWPAGTPLTHVYAAPGTYHPTVQITDEGDNTAAAPVTGSVTVTADTVKPLVSVGRPASHRTWLRSWVTLRGGASDTATSGVRRVQVQVVEKRGATWYAYKAATRRWVKAGTTKAAALRKVGTAQVSTTGAWSYRLRGLRLGTLVVRACAVDNVGNVSGWATRSQRLTHS